MVGLISEDMFFLLMGIFILILYGVVTYLIGRKKGYKGVKGALWFFLGFFFQVIGIIIAIRRPECPDEFVKELHRSPLFRDEWEAEDREKEKKKEEEFLSVNGGWNCVFCGTKNFGYVGTCACGKTKQESAS